jgi:transposase
MCLTQVLEGILGMAVPVYPSDLTDDAWALLAPLIPSSKPHGRPRSWDMRRLTNEWRLLRAAHRLRLGVWALSAAGLRSLADGVLGPV